MQAVIAAATDMAVKRLATRLISKRYGNAAVSLCRPEPNLPQLTSLATALLLPHFLLQLPRLDKNIFKLDGDRFDDAGARLVAVGREDELGEGGEGAF